MIVVFGIDKYVPIIDLVSFMSENWSACVQQDEEEDEEDEGVSRVRVTSRRSPHKVERVSGLVTRSHVDVPKVSKAKHGDREEKAIFPGVSWTQLLPQWFCWDIKKGSCC